VPKIRKRDGAVANKAWKWVEVDAALKRATGGVRKAIAARLLRKKDVVELPRSARARDEIEFGSSS
jgi:hypothetical protein